MSLILGRNLKVLPTGINKSLIPFSRRDRSGARQRRAFPSYQPPHPLLTALLTFHPTRRSTCTRGGSGEEVQVIPGRPESRYAAGGKKDAAAFHLRPAGKLRGTLLRSRVRPRVPP